MRFRPLLAALALAALLGQSLLGPSPDAASAQTSGTLPLIVVDQFGYRPGGEKVAVLVDRGSGVPAQVEVRRVTDGEVVLTGTSREWNGGAVDGQSGDRGAWFDFTSVASPGTYELVDPATGSRSDRFVIADDVYDELLDQALLVFWRNRGNVAHSGPTAGPWTSPVTLVGSDQDRAARWVDDPRADTARDLSGGWYDAGDTNRYVTFASAPVHQLLAAYRDAPDVFDDDLGIPESGNGIPDVLDEVRVELEWVERMANPDGSVLLKVGFRGYAGGTPILADDTRPRFYEEACSSSTIAAAGMFAHGAVVFADVDADWAAQLRGRALAAWDRFVAGPIETDCDPQLVNAGDADMPAAQQIGEAVTAAAYLFDLTGEARFSEYVGDHLAQTQPWTDGGFGRYDPEQTEALIHYRSLPDADSAIVARIEQRAREVAGFVDMYGSTERSLYRSYLPDPQYHWGSNMVNANTGVANLLLEQLGVGDDGSRRARAEAHLANLHGVNPVGLVYLSAMDGFGAERSVTELYHFAFGDGTPFDRVGRDREDLGGIGPAPGYVVGGPNANYSGPAAALQGRPPAASYLDWNDSDEASWEISEPAIYYQSAYVRLLAALSEGRVAPPGGGGPAPIGQGGYWMIEADGQVHGFGDAANHAGDGRSAVSVATTPSGAGLWVLRGDGSVRTLAGARHHGDVDTAALDAGEAPSAISVLADGSGYWVFTDRGRAIAFGAAVHHGDMVGVVLNGAVVASSATPSGDGYYMIGADGGVFAFGDAEFAGSMGGRPLNGPVVGIAPDPDGRGYWLVADDGGIFAFDAEFAGSMGGRPLNRPVIGAAAFADAYLLVATDGGIFNFSEAPFFGSLGASPPDTPVLAVAAFAE
ncbi:MAG: glycoside hydrolase family 9 protein [Actinomycetota bacterium]